MNWKGKNGVERPYIRETDGDTMPRFIQRMNQIEPVEIVLIFDNDDEPRVQRKYNNSARVLEWLNKASLKTGYVLELKIMGESVGPRVLTRLNFMLSRTGWGSGSFRGWRRSMEAVAGKALWGSAMAWKDLLSMLGHEDE